MEVGPQRIQVGLRRKFRADLTDVGPSVAELRAHLAQKLENEAFGLFGHGAILAASPTAVSGSFEDCCRCDRSERMVSPIVVSVLVLSYGGTLFGYGLWARLLAHHSAATVAPFALLVPVVGLIAAALVFGEALSALELVGGALVMAGLALNVFGDWALRRRLPAFR